MSATTLLARLRARITRTPACTCLSEIGGLHLSFCPLASDANVEASANILGVCLECNAVDPTCPCFPAVARQCCELKLVTDCEVFTRTLEMIDGRQVCPTCALIVPDLIADVKSSGLTVDELERACVDRAYLLGRSRPFRSSIQILGLDELERSILHSQVDTAKFELEDLL